MNWLTKSLAIDLLGLTRTYLDRVIDRLRTEGDDPWANSDPIDDAPQWVTVNPPTNPALDSETVTEATAEVSAPETETSLPEAETPTPPADTTQLHTQAQTLLRTIVENEGTDWVVNTLFPIFQVTTLDAVTPDRLGELIDYATQHINEATQ